MSKDDSPWASGPSEILRHGLDLLKKDTDTNRRLAMISIDNAVELTVKTYLGLPKRVTGLLISRKEFQEISESFPAMLDALEKYAADKLTGIDLGEIEWYHRLRNQLYHQGNGLTVERNKVEIYAQLANTLFENLFGMKLIQKVSDSTELFGEFMMAWRDLEMALNDTFPDLDTHRARTILDLMRDLSDSGILSKQELKELDGLRHVRNSVAHARPTPAPLTSELVQKLNAYAQRIKEHTGD
jgi:hypothetical protein